MNIVLPADIWWPLRVSVKRGEVVPMTTWFYWTAQFFRPREIA